MSNKKKTERDKYMTIEDWHKFRAIITEPFEQMLWDLVVSCGLRIGEAMIVTWQDFDFERNILHAKTLKRKGHPAFPVDVPEGLCRKFERLSEFVRDEFDGRFFPYTTVWAWKKFKKACKKANLNERFSPHALRHLHGILLSEETKGDLVKISRGLRHAHVMTAEKYVHVAPELRRGLAEKVWEKL